MAAFTCGLDVCRRGSVLADRKGRGKKEGEKKNVQITARKKDEGKGGRRGREGGDGDLKTWLERVFLGNWW